MRPPTRSFAVAALLALALVRCSVEEKDPEVRAAVASASRFAELDPYRATTHNKGIMNDVDAVLVATGQDWRAVEAGAHAYAARSGVYRPLAVWRDDGVALVGELVMPLAVGTVGGALHSHPSARFALDMAGIITAPVASATRPKPITLCTLDSPSCLLVLFTGKLFQYDRKIKRQNERSVD